MKNWILSIVLICLFASGAYADKIQVRTEVPRSVICDEEFRLQFIINTADVASISFPSVPFAETLYGPSHSLMQNYTNINGKQTSSVSVTYTYVMLPHKAGKYTIPAAEISLKNGSKYKSTPVSINVLPVDKKTSSNSKSTNRELFILAEVNKTNLFEQEAVVLTYKIYSKVSIKNLTNKMPDLKGFLVQEIPLPQQKTFQVENYEGENYRTTVWSQYVLFPQQSGELVIPSVKFESIIVRPNQSIDPFDDFLNGNSIFAEQKKIVMAPQVRLHVSSLPEGAPASYSGAVGTFSVKASTSGQAATNEAFHYRLTVIGKGNLKLMKAPKIEFPKDFEVYDPQIVDKTSLNGDGQTGSIEYDYLLVPRKVGPYTLPEVKFSYYDLQGKTYKTVSTKPIKIQVKQGQENSSNDSSMSGRNVDIRPIKRLDNGSNNNMVGIHMNDLLLIYATSLLFVVLFYILLSRYGIYLKFHKGHKHENFLEEAQKQLSSEQYQAFYNTISNALVVFIVNIYKGDNQIANDLRWEYALNLMKDKQLSSQLIERIQKVMDACNMARYAKSANYDEAEKLMREVELIVTDLNGYCRNKKRR